MKTPHLDEKIESLKWKIQRMFAYEHEKEQLEEYEAIKEALSIHSVMCSVKTTDLISLDYGEEYIERFECPNCKNPIEMDNFCSSCGSKIEE